MELLFTVLGLGLTLMVFSWLFGDNFLFRLAAGLLIGVSAGAVLVVLWFEVLIPRLFTPLGAGQWLGLLLPLLLILLLAARFLPGGATVARIPLAFLVGSGAALTIAGAVLGSLYPLLTRPLGAAPSNWLNAVLTLLGTLSVLAAFHYTFPNLGMKSSGASPASQAWTWFTRIGQIFIGLTLGAVYAGVLNAALTALAERSGELLLGISLLFTGK